MTGPAERNALRMIMRGMAVALPTWLVQALFADTGDGLWWFCLGILVVVFLGVVVPYTWVADRAARHRKHQAARQAADQHVPE